MAYGWQRALACALCMGVTSGCGEGEGGKAGAGGSSGAGLGGTSSGGSTTGGSGGQSGSTSMGGTIGAGGSAGSAGMGGAAGVGGAGAAGGAVGFGGAAGFGGVAGTSGGGASGAAGSGNSVCPQAPPEAGPCDGQGLSCVYEDCEGSGRTIANCVPSPQNLRWAITNTPCGEEVECMGDGSGMTCPTGQVCLVLAGGALITECATHTCGAGPLECACIDGCQGTCTALAHANGLTLTCNTCSDPRGCP